MANGEPVEVVFLEGTRAETPGSSIVSELLRFRTPAGILRTLAALFAGPALDLPLHPTTTSSVVR